MSGLGLGGKEPLSQTSRLTLDKGCTGIDELQDPLQPEASSQIRSNRVSIEAVGLEELTQTRRVAYPICDRSGVDEFEESAPQVMAASPFDRPSVDDVEEPIPETRCVSYPLYDRSGVDEADGPLLKVTLPEMSTDLNLVQPEATTQITSRSLRCQGALILVALAAANALFMGMLVSVGSRYPSIVSPGILAFTFGLRHAVDADHIAAIDNVTRKVTCDSNPGPHP